MSESAVAPSRAAILPLYAAGFVTAFGSHGIAANLDTALAVRMKSDPIARARNADEVPLSSAIGLVVRERLTGREAPAAAAAAVVGPYVRLAALGRSRRSASWSAAGGRHGSAVRSIP